MVDPHFLPIRSAVSGRLCPIRIVPFPSYEPARNHALVWDLHIGAKVSGLFKIRGMGLKVNLTVLEYP
jgi:hypothetical protein